MRKNIIIISLIFFLTNCGFAPIYLNNAKVNYSIEQINYEGDRELNNFLKTNLNQYKSDKDDNKISIETNSVYKKNILSKNKAGEVSDYQIEAKVIFIIKPSDKEVIITEKKIMKSMDDKFEETRNERSIKQNFASSISQKLITELTVNQ